MRPRTASGLAGGRGDRQPGPRPSQDPCGLHRCTRRLARVGMASACCREGQARVQARRRGWSASLHTYHHLPRPSAWGAGPDRATNTVCSFPPHPCARRPARVGTAAHRPPPVSAARMETGAGRHGRALTATRFARAHGGGLWCPPARSPSRTLARARARGLRPVAPGLASGALRRAGVRPDASAPERWMPAERTLPPAHGRRRSPQAERRALRDRFRPHAGVSEADERPRDAEQLFRRAGRRKCKGQPDARRAPRAATGPHAARVDGAKPGPTSGGPMLAIPDGRRWDPGLCRLHWPDRPRAPPHGSLLPLLDPCTGSGREGHAAGTQDLGPAATSGSGIG